MADITLLAAAPRSLSQQQTFAITVYRVAQKIHYQIVN